MHHRIGGIVHVERHLLVTVVSVYVRIARHTDFDAHSWFQDRETSLSHWLVVPILKDLQLVVATHLQFHVVVRNLQRVVVIEHGSTRRRSVVLYSHAIESVHVVAFHQFRLLPVGIAMGDGVGVSHIRVLQIVETDFHPVPPT